MRFDIPRDRMLEVAETDIVFDSAPHPYEVEHAEAIEANWQGEAARNPALFDGKVMLFSRLAWRAGKLDASCHAVRFATYLYWRRTRASATAEHLYSHAMPVTSDGALVTVRMGAHTANAGRVYFAAGSLDLDDVRNGRIDIAHNMVREVREETGIDLSGCKRDAAYHGYSSNGGTVIVRRYYLAEPADVVERRIRHFIAAESDPEIAEAVIVRGEHDLPDGLAAHMPPLIAWHFGAGR